MLHETEDEPKRRPKPIRRRKTPRSKRYAPERSPAAVAAAPPAAAPAAQVEPAQRALALVLANGIAQPAPVDDLALDLLHGQSSIARFIGVTVRRAEYMLQRGQLPARRVGRSWIGSRARLRAFFQEARREDAEK